MASTPHELLERCVRLLWRWTQEDSILARELKSARVEFFRSDLAEQDSHAEKRFQEWFLFERSSIARAEPPVFSFQEKLLQELPEESRGLAEGFAESVFGIFEIEEEMDGRWSFQDLLNQREYAVRGPIHAPDTVVVSRNFVGRLFPWGEGEYVLSASTRQFVLDEELWEALREDLNRVRKAHSGSRISQAALEGILWPKDVAPILESGDAAAKWDELVGESRDFSSIRVKALLGSATHPGPVMAEILDRLAFETDLDLDEARKLLPHLLEVSKSPPAAPKLCRCGSALPYDDCCRGSDAVRAFEEGKARGENLDTLFQKLEEDMGLESEEDEDPGEAPTQPELTLLAEEFLWEVHPEAGREELLAMFHHFENEHNPPITHLEELREEPLRKYLSLLFPASKSGKDPEKARALLQALVRFALWADIEHGTQIAQSTESLAKNFEIDFPRIASCNQAVGKSLAGKTDGPLALEPWEILKSPSNHRAEVRSLRDETVRFVAADGELASNLRAGDLVFAKFARTAAAEQLGTIQVVFSKQAKPFLE